MKTLLILLLATLAAAQTRNLYQELVFQNFTILVNLTNTAGLQTLLATTPGITIFAPENDAFSPDDLNRLTTPQLIAAFLTYHVTPQILLAQNFQNDRLVATAGVGKIRTNKYNLVFSGLPITISTVNGNGIGPTDEVNCTNGVLTKISRVLYAPTNSTLVAVREYPVSTISLFPTMVALSGLSTLLNGNENNSFTILAPTDDAINALPQAWITALQRATNLDILQKILRHHVILGAYFIPALIGDPVNVTTAAGTSLEINIDIPSSSIIVQGTDASALALGFLGTDGVGYALNSTLIPPFDLEFTVRLFDLTTLVNALQAEGFDFALAYPVAVGASSLTIFAPTNNAFSTVTPAQNATIQNDLDGVLYYHVVNNTFALNAWTNDQLLTTLTTPPSVIRLNKYVKPSGTVYTANGVVVSASRTATTGVMHVVDKVLFPATIRVNTTLYTDSRLSIFRTAVIAANVLPLLALYNVPVTIFAPTDDAFNALPNGTLAALLNNTQMLVQVLTNHVVLGSVYSPAFFNGQTITTAATLNLTVTVAGNTITVGGATVLQADINHIDGVIHVIDRVLIPQIPPATTGAASTGVATTGAVGTGASASVQTTEASSAGKMVAGMLALCLAFVL